LPTSGNTVRRWILQEFEEHTRMLKDEMNKALSKVHTSFDMWTSPNGIAILSVIAYYVDIAGTPQVRLISLEKLSGSHGGENQAILMAKVIRKYMAELGVWFVDDTLKGLMVKADNDTRWNSVYLMVHRALRLRDIIDVFCKLSLLDPKEEKRVSAEDVLSCEDWVVLAEIIEILQPYLTYTKHFEGRTPRFAEVLPTMYLLKDHLSEMRQRYSSNLIPAPYRAPRITLEEP
ncbi:unnamed protein product, partial [Fusarium langsethiae]